MDCAITPRLCPEFLRTTPLTGTITDHEKKADARTRSAYIASLLAGIRHDTTTEWRKERVFRGDKEGHSRAVAFALGAH
jgi:hypothetical protein